MLLVYFPSGRCVDVVNDRTSHQFTSVNSRTFHE